MTRHAEKSVLISGIGQSQVARPADVSPLSLTLDACLAAIADSGLSIGEIDGIATYPGFRDDGSGFSPVMLSEVRHALDVETRWYSATTTDSAGHMSAFFNAIAAIASGLVRHVLVYRTVGEATARSRAADALITAKGARVEALFEYPMPFNAVSPATWYGLHTMRHFHEFGTTAEQLGAIAVNGRAMAALNPNAIYRNPITIDDYLASRMISSPLRIFDCDVPIDASTAFILSSVDSAAGSAPRSIRIEAIGSSMSRRSIMRPDSFTSFYMESAADMMWSRTDLKPADVDVAQIYDGFSCLTLYWLEALGFCGRGEAGAFVEGGHRIGLDGSLPMNTSGGQLSAGRFHGFGHIHEACLQLRGEAGERQVRDDPQVSAVSNGAFGHGCMVLTRR
jgi:acetyl-CoA acetyltransferase